MPVGESTFDSIMESMQATTPHHCQLSTPKMLCMLLLQHLKKTPINIGSIHRQRPSSSSQGHIHTPKRHENQILNKHILYSLDN